MSDQIELLEELLMETKRLSKLVGISVTLNLGTNEKIIMLSRTGLTPKEIADIIGKPPILLV